MNKLGIEPIEKEKAKIEVNDNPNGVTVELHGKIDMQNPGAIFNPYFDKLHQKIVEHKVKEVIVDFGDLSLLNSSGIKVLIKWVTQLSRLKPDDKYKMRILYNKDITWQVTSLTPFTHLVPDLVSVEPK